MFYVAGAPVKLFAENLTEAGALALIPITNKRRHRVLSAVEIPAGTYPGQPNAVPTVAVKAVLISFDFRWRECDLVGQFAQTVSANLQWLVQNGHPKWKSVDLNAPLKGWEQYDCVSKRLGGRAATPAKPSTDNRSWTP